MRESFPSPIQNGNGDPDIPGQVGGRAKGNLIVDGHDVRLVLISPGFGAAFFGRPLRAGSWTRSSQAASPSGPPLAAIR